MAIVFAGQGVAALQLTGTLPIHPLRLPSVPALGMHPTLETWAVQGALLALAAVAFVLDRRAAPNLAPATRPVRP
jgi:high-affinity iron transporter